jgi:DNA-binding NarL/FixJ family response regulator
VNQGNPASGGQIGLEAFRRSGQSTNLQAAHRSRSHDRSEFGFIDESLRRSPTNESGESMKIERRIAVQILHDDPLLAAGLQAILSADPEVDIVDATIVGSQFFHRHGADVNVDVVVADYEHGIQRATKPLVQAVGNGLAEARVMVFTPRDGEWEIRSALQAGVHGYLVQGCSADEALCGVKSIARGIRYFGPLVAQRMADSITHAALTAREGDVLELLSHGMSNKLIARELELATGTVKSHLRAILSKLGASSRTQAVLLAAQRGLVKRTALQRLESDLSDSGAPPRQRLAHGAPVSVGAAHYA